MKSGRHIHRNHRKKMAVAIRGWLSGELPTADLMQVAMDLHGTSDSAVVYVTHQFEYFFEDYINLPKELSKQDWDHLQRMLLLLDSNRRLTTEHQILWSRTQILAAIALLVFVALAFMVGWNLVVLISAPFLLVSWYLSSRRWRLVSKPYGNVLEPFGSFDQLRSTYESTPNFNKRRFPFDKPKPRSWLMRTTEKALSAVLMGMILTFLAVVPPFSLFYQLLPVIDRKVEVVT